MNQQTVNNLIPLTNVLLTATTVLLTAILAFLTYRYVTVTTHQLDSFKRDVRTAKFLAASDHLIKIVDMIFEHPELSKLFEGHPNFPINHNDPDAVRRRWFIILRLSCWEFIYLQYKAGILDQQDLSIWFHFMITTLNHCPEWRKVWTETKADWDPNFSNYISTRLTD